MSAAITELLDVRIAAANAERVAIQREPFYLQSQGQPLFGWLHTCQTGSNINHGVVICSPLGHEQLHTHRTLRHLADTLAQQGIPTLRFDWHGTGDSAGIDEDGARGATWQANIRDGLNWMRQRLGCRHVSVVGLRLGATLAVLASEDHEIANLVLWAPVTNGRAYVREMMAIDMTSEFRPCARQVESGDIEAGGFVLSKLAAAELSLINLIKSHPHFRHGLIVTRDDVPADYRLLDRCTDLGFPTEQISVSGYQDMLAEPHKSRVPQQAIKDISNWLRQQIYSEPVSKLFITPPRGGRLPCQPAPEIQSVPNASVSSSESDSDLPQSALMKHQPELSAPLQGSTTIRERTLQISATPHLFGILSEPSDPVDPARPTIILLNSGSTHRIGPGRLNVHLARQLAVNGYRCLRLDINGLGDSITTDVDRENETYPETVFRDVDLTLKKLTQEFGSTRQIVVGLCSGAYAAFQSAVCIQDPTLIESVLLNPLTFFWQDGMSLETAPSRDFVAQQHYLASALKPEKWLKLLSGRSKIGFKGIWRMVMKRLQSLVRKPTTSIKPAASKSRGLSHPIEDDLSADLSSIAASGRKLTMIFATSDPGHAILMTKAKRRAEQLRKSGTMRISFIKHADHTFSRRTARQELIEMLLKHLGGRSS